MRKFTVIDIFSLQVQIEGRGVGGGGGGGESMASQLFPKKDIAVELAGFPSFMEKPIPLSTLP